MRFSARDWELLYDVYRLQAVSAEQIHTHHFVGTSVRNARYRLSALVTQEALARTRVVTNERAVTVYTIHPRFIGTMATRAAMDLDPPSEYRRRQISAMNPMRLRHRLTLNEVYFTIRRHVGAAGIVHWLDGKEGAVHRSRGDTRTILRPDGRYDLPERTLWFEVDFGTMRRLQTIEKLARYREAFEQGADLPDTPHHIVAFMTTGPSRANHIADLAAATWRGTRGDPKRAVVTATLAMRRVTLYAAPAARVLAWLDDRMAEDVMRRRAASSRAETTTPQG